MTTVTRPRGPLPARVYWTRRLLLVVVAFALVFGIARLLGVRWFRQPVRAAGRRRRVDHGSAAAAPDTAVTTPQASPTGAGRKNRTGTPTPTPLAEPTGACAGSDVVATPSLKRTAYAGSSVVFTMTLGTLISPACTFDVSSRSMVVKVDLRQRPDLVQPGVRAAPSRSSPWSCGDQPVTVSVGWNGQRSDPTAPGPRPGPSPVSTTWSRRPSGPTRSTCSSS